MQSSFLLISLLLSLPSLADPGYEARSNDVITILLPNEANSGLPTPPPAAAQCLACHAASGPPVNAFGTALQDAAVARGFGRGNSASWNTQTIFRAIYEDVIDLDSDGDGALNRAEFIGRSNPGNASSLPPPVSPDEGEAPPPPSQEVITLNRSNSAQDGDDKLLSGCGGATAASLSSSELSRHQAGISTRHSWFGLIVFLPLILLFLLRRPVPVKIRNRKSDS